MVARGQGAVHQDWTVLYREITALLDGGSLPWDQQIQELVRRHFDIACRFYIPSRQAYVGMSLFYAESEAMRAFHDSYHPDLVEFLGAAIKVFAEQGAGSPPAQGPQLRRRGGDNDPAMHGQVRKGRGLGATAEGVGRNSGPRARDPFSTSAAGRRRIARVVLRETVDPLWSRRRHAGARVGYLCMAPAPAASPPAPRCSCGSSGSIRARCTSARGAPELRLAGLVGTALFAGMAPCGAASVPPAACTRYRSRFRTCAAGQMPRRSTRQRRQQSASRRQGRRGRDLCAGAVRSVDVVHGILGRRQ
ncbi:TipAS antibiotic-recognition domain-containing protein [Streptomyces sp. NPDC088707]|uniref:TipAS antibiotic-recognition domain-containing protein n=1 Tax=Streptomyces sp. NPDC088707 TaxID=3365871 RepID=UPI00381E9E8F